MATGVVAKLFRLSLPCTQRYVAANGRPTEILSKFHRPFCPSIVPYCTTFASDSDVRVSYDHGLPVISVILPSRQERCNFILKPVNHTVGDFLTFLHEEDGGIDRTAIYTIDGIRISKSTSIDCLMRSEFKLTINSYSYNVKPPETGLANIGNESVESLESIRSTIARLYTQLQIDEYQMKKEQELLLQLENLREELKPMEQYRKDLEIKANIRTNRLAWGGLAYMALQTGFLARLTWFEYSWDIMEPVTYFVTYGSTMLMYAYFVVTKQEYYFPGVKDREFLFFFHKNAKKQKLDVERYNELKDLISEKELQVKRLQDPLQLQLPMQQLEHKVKRLEIDERED